MQSHDAGHPPKGGILIQHRVSGFSKDWVIGDYDKVPQAAWHHRALQLLEEVLTYWVQRNGRNAAVFRDLALRPLQVHPNAGIDPDLMIVEPAPARPFELSSLRLWEPDHAVPALAVEVVSPNHPWKDYVQTPDQCATAGIKELIVFDPMLVGPRIHDGPRRLQVWRRLEHGAFARVDSGDGPFRSEYLGAYLVVIEEGRRLRVSEDEEGRYLWPTRDEAECVAKEWERAEKERERAEKERALARVAELEEELRKRDAK
jgi:Uma2 family endonuclease